MAMRKTPPGLRMKGPKHWQKAGIVGVTFLREHIQRPQVGRRRERPRAAVANYFCGADVLQNVTRSDYIITKFVRIHLLDTSMAISLTGDFMSPSGNLPNDLGVTLSDPTHHKERRFRVEPI